MAALLEEPSVRVLVAGELEAVFLPTRGMLCASLRHRGEELLGRVEDLEGAAAHGSTAGIPLLYPWANRLGAARYQAAGRTVVLDLTSPLLHLDERGLPIHGVPWARLAWEVTKAGRRHLSARLNWLGEDLLAIFPFRHRLELEASLAEGGLTFDTRVAANGEDAVPVCFGFHPYLRLPGLPRSSWQLRLPAMSRWVLDERGVATGAETPFPPFDGPLDEVGLDDGFSLHGAEGTFTLCGAGRSLRLELLSGYAYAQVFAPLGKQYVALEPMTAPTGALVHGRGLRTLKPGEVFHARFRVGVEDAEK